RNVLRTNREQYYSLVQYFVVVEVVQQGMRYAFLACREEHRCSWHAQRGVLGDALDKRLQRDRPRVQLGEQDLAPTLPGGKHDENDNAHDDREPAALENLQ